MAKSLQTSTSMPGTGPASPKTPSGAAQATSPKSPASPAAGQPSSPQSAVTEAEPSIPVDEAPDHSFDLDDNASSSVSITSSIRRYQYENGRRYHAYKAGAYIAPNDDIESERLNLQHYMFRNLTFDGAHFTCPADPAKMHRVLDCGTGTGIWAIDLADDFPNLEVIGVDLSPTQPDFVPPNVRFYVEDVEDSWTHSHPFDFIYSRMMTGSIANFPRYFEQCYENLTPGGWIELADISFPLECDDDTMTKDSAALEWSNLMLKASANLGRDAGSGRSYKRQLADAGFINIVEKKYKWPVNHWSGDPKYRELGIFMFENLGKNLSGVSLALFTRGLGWSQTQAEVFLVNVRKEMKDPNIHAYAPIWVVYGQKPHA